MAFKGRKPGDIDFDSLQVTLVNSRLQQTNRALYQTISQLIARVRQSRTQVDTILQTITGDIDIDTSNNLQAILIALSNLVNANILTWTNESAILINSRELVAGLGVTFDDTIANQRIINAAGVSYVPMVTGAEPLEIMSNGAGDLLLIAYTP
jgi:hypothetical protein